MVAFPIDATVSAAAAAAAFGASLYRVVGVRFEAPFVFYSIALFGRLIGTGSAFAYPPASGGYLPISADGDLGFLLFYPLLIGALRFARRAYRSGGKSPEARRVLLAALALIVVDAARLVWLLSMKPIPFFRGAYFPSFPVLPSGVWAIFL